MNEQELYQNLESLKNTCITALCNVNNTERDTNVIYNLFEAVDKEMN